MFSAVAPRIAPGNNSCLINIWGLNVGILLPTWDTESDTELLRALLWVQLVVILRSGSLGFSVFGLVIPGLSLAMLFAQKFLWTRMSGRELVGGAASPLPSLHS